MQARRSTRACSRPSAARRRRRARSPAGPGRASASSEGGGGGRAHRAAEVEVRPVVRCASKRGCRRAERGDEEGVGSALDERPRDVNRVHLALRRARARAGSQSGAAARRSRASGRRGRPARPPSRIGSRTSGPRAPRATARSTAPIATCAGFCSPRVPRIEITSGTASPYGIASEPSALAALPSPEDCMKSTGRRAAMAWPAANATHSSSRVSWRRATPDSTRHCMIPSSLESGTTTALFVPHATRTHASCRCQASGASGRYGLVSRPVGSARSPVSTAVLVSASRRRGERGVAPFRRSSWGSRRRTRSVEGA